MDETKKRYLVILMDAILPQERESFLEQLCASLLGPIIAYFSINEDGLKDKLHEAARGRDDIAPVLVYFDPDGDAPQCTLSDLVFAASHATLATGNAARVVEYDMALKDHRLAYTFAV